MNLVGCIKCLHLFLSEVVDPDLSYSNYQFNSASSPALKNFMSESIDWLLSQKTTLKSGLVLDIGANDGTWLELFAARGFEVFGVEPSNQFEVMSDKGIPGIRDYFDVTSSAEIEMLLNKDGKEVSIITVNNTFANVEHPSEFIANIVNLMNDETLLSIVTGYHLDQFPVGMFDYIYHEHLSYFSVSDFNKLAEIHNLEILNVRKFPLKGGSIQIIMRKKTSRENKYPDTVLSSLMWESWFIRNHGDYFENISLQIKGTIERGREICNAVLDSGYNFHGYGYSHSSATLMYELQLQNRLIGIFDDNSSRQGKYTPGSGIKICDPSDELKNSEGVIILAWQHDARILEKLKEFDYRGVILHPFQGIKKLT